MKLIVGDKCMGMLEAVGEVFPDAKYQRVHFYRNVFSVVPRSKAQIAAKMRKAIHAQESKKAYCDFPSEHWTRIRTNNVIELMKLYQAAGSVWSNKKYMNMKHLETALDDASIAG